MHIPGNEKKLLPKMFGADGSPVDNVGELVAEGFRNDGHALKTDDGIGRVTTP